MSGREHSERPEPAAAPTAAGSEADPAEPAGDQDPAVEAERLEETERLRSVEAEPERGAEGTGDEARPEEGESGPPVDREEAPSGEEPEEPLARAEAQRDEYLALAQRAQADFENYRRRAAREIAAAGARAKAELARELLPVVDNLERALASADAGDGGLADGVRLVHSELVAALERNGVRSIEPAGERFDPNLHEALSTRAENGAEAGEVLDVVQKGYRLEESVLRPARVVVAA